MIPFLAFSGGNCQDARILVDVSTVREKLLGGCEGTAIEQFIDLAHIKTNGTHYVRNKLTIKGDEMYSNH